MTSTNNVLRQIDGKIHQTSMPNASLKPNQVRVKITHSGFCGTDHTYMPYGIALGHEGVGTVEEVGSSVTDLNVGDRVGGGYYRGSCGKCKYCTTGRESWCYTRDMYGESNTDNGTLSDHFIAEETYLYKIPDNMPSEEAAPLQCAGATVYKALVDHIRSGDRVGIQGIGGLGHLAIQFAAKLGATVVVLSTTRSKEQEAKDFGAHEFYLMDEVEKLSAPIDLLILTGSRFPDFERFFKKEILSRNATIVPISGDMNQMVLPMPSTLFNGYNISPSLVADRKTHRDMLNFAAVHQIHPVIEQFPLTVEGLTEAVKKMESGHLRYRAVLAN
ncbi:GroES-like protein [Rhizodiscina lignyota]|uniref:GroES-like protein n=1 Tax=Rhizodiscina lignyota TaxID=1504668 RepID=A0A9P4I9B5_9PEZI|nr:GroES-like protein [Rhizodiscina lignyota]